jgi:hypothetical protein
MYEANVTKNASKSVLSPQASLRKGISVLLAQVTNPKIKNNAPMVTIGEITDDFVWFAMI